MEVLAVHSKRDERVRYFSPHCVRMGKRILVGCVTITLALFAFYAWQLRAVDPSDTSAQSVMLERGQSVRSIADNLEKRGLIRSGTALLLYVRLMGVQSGIKAGTYSISPSLSTRDILALVQQGASDDVPITIPEGYTVAQIDALLAEKGIGKAGDFIACAFQCDVSEFSFIPTSNPGDVGRGFGSRVEGYLFPDTYFISPASYQPKMLLHRMLRTFDQRIRSVYAKDIEESGKKLSEIVTMASLVEEESRHEDERAIIAGILWKRLDVGMSLGVDATVRYIVGKQSRPITKADLDDDSAYNTRKFLGLPPGPIANAGESSLLAALRPSSSEYLYYLHDSSGDIHFARTNEEHVRNKARYLQ